MRRRGSPGPGTSATSLAATTSPRPRSTPSISPPTRSDGRGGGRPPHPIGRYWRAALVVFFNYGVDTGTVWRSTPAHEPILWRHVIWDRKSPDREAKERSPWGWLFYRRVKTDKAFYRPMNRVVHAHLRSLMSVDPRLDAPVFLGGARPNARFQALCGLAGIKPRLDIETGEEEPWELKDLRKTCATYYDEHVPESSVEILGHSVGGITYRHYAHRAPLAFRAIMTLPQPSAFSAILRGGGTASARAAGGGSPTLADAAGSDRRALAQFGPMAIRRGDWTPLELFMPGIRGLGGRIEAILRQVAG